MKRIVLILLLMVFGIASAMTPVGFNQAVFNSNATKFGNKAANLIELEKLAITLNQKKPGRFAVPAFFPISNDVIQAYLQEHNALNQIETLWQEFQKAQKGKLQDLSPQAKGHLKALENLIEKTFKDNPFPFFTELESFVKSAADKKQLFMVRSTGKEDTKELANAGGNKSIAAVKPEKNEISTAIGQVIASYFSEKSINQRMLAGDITVLTDTKPFMPVLLHVMVTGPNPVSGVLFSQEAEGQTKGVAQVQAAYGHGEGVVNGLVGVDTFYCGSLGIIHPLIRIKNDRIAPSADFLYLERKENNYLQAHNPCLGSSDVHDLTFAGDTIQSYYQTPMDIEFVLQDKVIYLVQARPLISTPNNPSFIKAEYLNSIAADRIALFTIGSAGGALQIIEQEEQLIIADTIGNALEKFLTPGKKNRVRVVITGQLAPATSHEATTFRLAGVAVVYCKELAPVRSWITDKKFPFVIDPQQEIALLFKENEKFTTIESIVQKGWFAHPIPKKISVFADFLPREKLELKKIETVKQLLNLPLAQLIQMVKEDSPQNAIDATHAIMHKIGKTIYQVQQSGKKSIILQLKNIYLHLLASATEVIAKSSSTDRLQRLYPITFFEALLKQIPDPSLFVNDYSIGALLKTEKQETKIAQSLQELKPGALKENIIQYAKAAGYALTNDVAQQWQQFLKQLATIKDTPLQRSFSQLMFDVASLNLMPLWINISFAQANSKNEAKAQAVAKELVNEYEASKEFLAFVKDINHKLMAFNPSNFNDPAAYEKQRRYLNQLANQFSTPKFKDSFAQNQFNRMVALPVMQKLVEVFDASIKALEASKSYSDLKQKINRFKELLDAYLMILNNWASIFEPVKQELDEIAKKTRETENKYFQDFDEYLEEIKRLMVFARAAALLPEPNASAFLPTSRFNVAAAIIGSYANFSRSTGQAYESNNTPSLKDAFTLIHQNLLVVLSIFSKSSGISQIKVPPLVQEITTKIQNMSIEVQPATMVKEAIKSTISLLGINLDKVYLTYYYNFAVRNHSSTLQVKYELASPHRIFISLQALGEARKRWDVLELVIGLAGRIIPTTENPIIDKRKGLLQVTWLIDQKNFPYVIQLITIILKFLGGTVSDIFKEIVGMIQHYGKLPDQGKLTVEQLNAVLPYLTAESHLVVYKILRDLVNFPPNIPWEWFDQFVAEFFEHPELRDSAQFLLKNGNVPPAWVDVIKSRIEERK